jgi:myo-inositol-1(or 4)-monophosphatase
MAAGIVIVREAGGFITDIDGGDEILGKGNVICGNDSIHRELLTVLRDAAKT